MVDAVTAITTDEISNSSGAGGPGRWRHGRLRRAVRNIRRGRECKEQGGPLACRQMGHFRSHHC